MRELGKVMTGLIAESLFEAEVVLYLCFWWTSATGVGAATAAREDGGRR